jgi:tagaturonate epimerase
MGCSMQLEKFSFGVGDRFAHQAFAQLKAFQVVAEHGVVVVPVWNKSNREHSIIGSEPASVLAAARAAVETTGWKGGYHIDADHIGLATVERFLPVCDFFTIDVADFIGHPAPEADIEAFLARHEEFGEPEAVAGIAEPLKLSTEEVRAVAEKYLLAVQEAGRVYRRIAEAKGSGGFIPEVSMDETNAPQTPPELLVILAALADEKIPLQTIAPKFTGRFNKGVDYVGNVTQFAREFEDDLCVIAHAVKQYDLPANLKLSVHSGSDKFSLYGPIREILRRHGAGLHLKTAGTTWLEEVIGLAEAGGDGLTLAKEIYAEALAHREELCAPYATVIDIDPAKLPSAEEIQGWTSAQFVRALRHVPSDPEFNPHLRQLLHVGFKVAARMGRKYLDQLEVCAESVSRNVTHNLLDRHLRPLLLD